jgi:hypothetical protein
MPDGVWQTLALVNDWVKHAEAKAATTLAAGGALGGVLFALVQAEPDSGIAFRIVTVACAVFLFVGGVAAGMALRPRLRPNRRSLLYYDDIARIYGKRPDTYAAALAELVHDSVALTDAIARQIWANSNVARRKYFWGNVGAMGLLLALGALAVAAAVAVVQ